MNETIDKIKKLMALANNNPNAEEADSAMKFAARLMMQHNIKESDIKHVEQKAGKGARHDEDPDKWRTYVANGIACLYNCRAVWYAGDRTNSLAFIGRPVNTEACDVTYPWVINQIEALYKAHLRPGMSQKDRAVYRREFKTACAIRVGNRAVAIAKEMEAKGVEGVPTATSLVVVSQKELLNQEIDEFLADKKSKQSKRRKPEFKDYKAAIEGYSAGDQVKLNKEVKR